MTKSIIYLNLIELKNPTHAHGHTHTHTESLQNALSLQAHMNQVINWVKPAKLKWESTKPEYECHKAAYLNYEL
jgi:hypothetical protein